jgi:hypothetical protein
VIAPVSITSRKIWFFHQNTGEKACVFTLNSLILSDYFELPSNRPDRVGTGLPEIRFALHAATIKP